MSSLLIVKPVQPVAVVGRTELARTLTPDPKEAANTAAWGSIRVDFGAAVTIDSVFIGYHNAAAGQQWAAGTAAASGGGLIDTLVPTQPLQSVGYGELSHSFVRGAPLTSRYFEVNTNGGPGNVAVTIGVIAFGLAWQPEFGNEYGSGGVINDTGSADRLSGGGFAINEGVITGGWEWSMGDLSNDEMQRLYHGILRRVGNTKTVLVVEDPDPTDGLKDRLHWGLLTKIDRYERFAPNACRVSMRVDDWA